MKKYWYAGAVIACLMTIAILFVWGRTYTVVLTETQLTESLNEKFPFEKKYLSIFKLRFSNPKLQLLTGSNRIDFGCDVTTNIPSGTGPEADAGSISGTARLSGSLRYEATDAAIYVDDPQVEELRILGLSDKLTEKLTKTVRKAAKEFLSRAPLYRLKPTDVKTTAAKLILKNAVIKDKTLILTLGVG